MENQGIDLDTLMETNPSDLASLQHEALKAHVIATLDKIKKLVAEGKYDEILNGDYTQYSPSGDGYGEDNHYINFGYGRGALDIREVVEMLESRRGKRKK